MADREKAIFNYKAALEDVNEQLLISLKECVELLRQITDCTPDPEGWQEMIDLFNATIRERERVAAEKTFH